MTTAEPELPPAWRLHRYERVGSTNDEARHLARAGAGERTIVWAGEQTAGRGRRGRHWASPPGNLYLSIVLRPDCRPDRAAQLGFAAALALCGALEPWLGGAELRFKWPNDVLVGGRKVAGILLESETGEAGNVGFLILGMGVNLTSFPGDSAYPATSLAAAAGTAPSPASLLAAFVRQLESWLARWRTNGFSALRPAWLARAAALGQTIGVGLDAARIEGRFVDIDGEGALLLEMADGRRRIAAGDVFPLAG